MTDPIVLLEEFAARFARGEDPDPLAFLQRAGERSDELSDLLDAYLMAAPPPTPSAETLALMEAWVAGEPPLLELRRQRGARREAIVEAILVALGIDPTRRAKVAGHYHRLELGQLDLRRVDRRVLAAIADAIGVGLDQLAIWAAPAERPPGLAVYLRADALAGPPDELSAVVPRPPDEIDRLFGIVD